MGGTPTGPILTSNDIIAQTCGFVNTLVLLLATVKLPPKARDALVGPRYTTNRALVTE